jgi:phage shock protein PspC (stress-responsive transcriptional regulator)
MTEIPTAVPTSTSTSATRPMLRRSGTDKWLGGVCGGLAEHTGVDALIWRAGAIALALSGAGVVVYLALWVLMPPPADPAAPRNVVDQLAERLHGSVGGLGSGGSRPSAAA